MLGRGFCFISDAVLNAYKKNTNNNHWKPLSVWDILYKLYKTYIIKTKDGIEKRETLLTYFMLLTARQIAHARYLIYFYLT